MHYLILGGAGLMGSGTARDLLSPLSSGVSKVSVTDMSEGRLNWLAGELRDPRLAVKFLDVSDVAATIELIKSADVCINAVPTFAGYQMQIFESCLKAGKPYLDYGGMGVYTVKQKAWHEAWRNAGLPAVLGAGADPGISNLLCKAAAERLDTIERINLYCAVTLVGEESPVLVPPYSLATLLAEYSNPSQQFLEGKLREVPPRAGREVLELPAPWGPTEFMYTQHSEPLTVPFAEGIAEKGIQEMTWKLALPSDEQQGWISLVKAGFSDSADPVLINGIDVLPIQFLDQLVKRNIERKRASIPERQSHEIHLAIGCGSKDGRKAEVRCMVLAEPHELYAPYSDAATSMGASIAAQLLAVAPTKPGVWAPEEFFDVERYFSELRRRRFRFEVETRIWECAPSNLS